MSRRVFPDRASVRQSVGFSAALRRATASQTWTETVLAQIELAGELASLTRTLPLRLKPRDNRRRRDEWRSDIKRVRERLAELDPPPTTRVSGPSLDQAHHDDADRTHDATTRALGKAAGALEQVCPDDVTATPRMLLVAMNLRAAASDLEAVLSDGQTVLDMRGTPIPDDLIVNMRRSADLAAAIDADPEKARGISATDPLGSADEIATSVGANATDASRSLLNDALGPTPTASVHQVVDPDPQSWALNERSWVITVDLEDLDLANHLLARLPEATRREVGGRIILLAVGTANSADGSDGDPEGTSAPSEDVDVRRISLDVGFQLSSTPSRPSLPLTPANAAQWAEAAGVGRIATDQTSFVEALEDLIRRSGKAAIARMRTIPGAPFQAPGAERTVADSYASTLGSPDDDVRATAMRLLEAQVAAEEDGTSSTALAAVVLSGITGKEPTEEEEELLNAIAVMHFARFDSASPDLSPSD
jgi:hypothetical protein